MSQGNPQNRTSEIESNNLEGENDQLISERTRRQIKRWNKNAEGEMSKKKRLKKRKVSKKKSEKETILTQKAAVNRKKRFNVTDVNFYISTANAESIDDFKSLTLTDQSHVKVQHEFPKLVGPGASQIPMSLASIYHYGHCYLCGSQPQVNQVISHYISKMHIRKMKNVGLTDGEVALRDSQVRVQRENGKCTIIIPHLRFLKKIQVGPMSREMFASTSRTKVESSKQKEEEVMELGEISWSSDEREWSREKNACSPDYDKYSENVADCDRSYEMEDDAVDGSTEDNVENLSIEQLQGLRSMLSTELTALNEMNSLSLNHAQIISEDEDLAGSVECGKVSEDGVLEEGECSSSEDEEKIRSILLSQVNDSRVRLSRGDNRRQVRRPRRIQQRVELIGDGVKELPEDLRYTFEMLFCRLCDCTFNSALEITAHFNTADHQNRMQAEGLPSGLISSSRISLVEERIDGRQVLMVQSRNVGSETTVSQKPSLKERLGLPRDGNIASTRLGDCATNRQWVVKCLDETSTDGIKPRTESKGVRRDSRFMRGNWDVDSDDEHLHNFRPVIDYSDRDIVENADAKKLDTFLDLKQLFGSEESATDAKHSQDRRQENHLEHIKSIKDHGYTEFSNAFERRKSTIAVPKRMSTRGRLDEEELHSSDRCEKKERLNCYGSDSYGQLTTRDSSPHQTSVKDHRKHRQSSGEQLEHGYSSSEHSGDFSHGRKQRSSGEVSGRQHSSRELSGRLSSSRERNEDVGHSGESDKLLHREHSDRGQLSKEHSGRRHSSREHSDCGHSSREHSSRRHSSREHSSRRHSSRKHSGRRRSSREHSDRGHSSREHSSRRHSSREHSSRRHSSREHSGRRRSSREHSDRRHSSREHSARDRSDKSVTCSRKCRTKDSSEYSKSSTVKELSDEEYFHRKCLERTGRNPCRLDKVIKEDCELDKSRREQVHTSSEDHKQELSKRNKADRKTSDRDRHQCEVSGKRTEDNGCSKYSASKTSYDGSRRDVFDRRKPTKSLTSASSSGVADGENPRMEKDVSKDNDGTTSSRSRSGDCPARASATDRESENAQIRRCNLRSSVQAVGLQKGIEECKVRKSDSFDTYKTTDTCETSGLFVNKENLIPCTGQKKGNISGLTRKRGQEYRVKESELKKENERSNNQVKVQWELEKVPSSSKSVDETVPVIGSSIDNASVLSSNPSHMGQSEGVAFPNNYYYGSQPYSTRPYNHLTSPYDRNVMVQVQGAHCQPPAYPNYNPLSNIGQFYHPYVNSQYQSIVVANVMNAFMGGASGYHQNMNALSSYNQATMMQASPYQSYLTHGAYYGTQSMVNHGLNTTAGLTNESFPPVTMPAVSAISTICQSTVSETTSTLEKPSTFDNDSRMKSSKNTPKKLSITSETPNDTPDKRKKDLSGSSCRKVASAPNVEHQIVKEKEFSRQLRSVVQKRKLPENKNATLSEQYNISEGNSCENKRPKASSTMNQRKANNSKKGANSVDKQYVKTPPADSFKSQVKNMSESSARDVSRKKVRKQRKDVTHSSLRDESGAQDATMKVNNKSPSQGVGGTQVETPTKDEAQSTSEDISKTHAKIQSKDVIKSSSRCLSITQMKAQTKDIVGDKYKCCIDEKGAANAEQFKTPTKDFAGVSVNIQMSSEVIDLTDSPDVIDLTESPDKKAKTADEANANASQQLTTPASIRTASWMASPSRSPVVRSSQQASIRKMTPITFVLRKKTVSTSEDASSTEQDVRSTAHVTSTPLASSSGAAVAVLMESPVKVQMTKDTLPSTPSTISRVHTTTDDTKLNPLSLDLSGISGILEEEEKLSKYTKPVKLIGLGVSDLPINLQELLLTSYCSYCSSWMTDPHDVFSHYNSRTHQDALVVRGNHAVFVRRKGIVKEYDMQNRIVISVPVVELSDSVATPTSGATTSVATTMGVSKDKSRKIIDDDLVPSGNEQANGRKKSFNYLHAATQGDETRKLDTVKGFQPIVTAVSAALTTVITQIAPKLPQTATSTTVKSQDPLFSTVQRPRTATTALTETVAAQKTLMSTVRGPQTATSQISQTVATSTTTKATSLKPQTAATSTTTKATSVRPQAAATSTTTKATSVRPQAAATSTTTTATSLKPQAAATSTTTKATSLKPQTAATSTTTKATSLKPQTAATSTTTKATSLNVQTAATSTTATATSVRPKATATSTTTTATSLKPQTAATSTTTTATSLNVQTAATSTTATATSVRPKATATSTTTTATSLKPQTAATSTTTTATSLKPQTAATSTTTKATSLKPQTAATSTTTKATSLKPQTAATSTTTKATFLKVQTVATSTTTTATSLKPQTAATTTTTTATSLKPQTAATSTTTTATSLKPQTAATTTTTTATSLKPQTAATSTTTTATSLKPQTAATSTTANVTAQRSLFSIVRGPQTTTTTATSVRPLMSSIQRPQTAATSTTTTVTTQKAPMSSVQRPQKTPISCYQAQTTAFPTAQTVASQRAPTCAPQAAQTTVTQTRPSQKSQKNANEQGQTMASRIANSESAEVTAPRATHNRRLSALLTLLSFPFAMKRQLMNELELKLRSDVRCIICDKTMHCNDIKTHVMGYRHKMKRSSAAQSTQTTTTPTTSTSVQSTAKSRVSVCVPSSSKQGGCNVGVSTSSGKTVTPSTSSNLNGIANLPPSISSRLGGFVGSAKPQSTNTPTIRRVSRPRKRTASSSLIDEPSAKRQYQRIFDLANHCLECGYSAPNQLKFKEHKESRDHISRVAPRSSSPPALSESPPGRITFIEPPASPGASDSDS